MSTSNPIRSLFQPDIALYERKLDAASKAFIDYNEKDFLETYYEIAYDLRMLKDTILRIEQEFGDKLDQLK